MQIIGALTHAGANGFKFQTSCRLYDSDLFLYIVHKDEADPLRARLSLGKGRGYTYPRAKRYDIVTHSFQPTNGLIPFGAMREFSVNALKGYGKFDDTYLSVDDDCCEAKLLDFERFRSNERAYGTGCLSGAIINQALKASARKVRGLGFPFFTLGGNSSQMKEAGPAIRFAGKLGFFHDSPNPFRSWDTQCEDAWAATRIVKEFDNRGLYEDSSVSLCFKIDTKKYAPVGADYADHDAANRALLNETHRDLPIWKWGRNVKARGYRNIHPNKTLLQQLRGTNVRYRGVQLDTRPTEPRASMLYM